MQGNGSQWKVYFHMPIPGLAVCLISLAWLSPAVIRIDSHQLYDKQSFFASCVLRGLNLPYLKYTLGLSEEENPLLLALAFRFFYSVLDTDAPLSPIRTSCLCSLQFFDLGQPHKLFFTKVQGGHPRCLNLILIFPSGPIWWDEIPWFGDELSPLSNVFRWDDNS